MTDAELIDDFIRRRGVTRCPTTCVGPTEGAVISAQDQAAIEKHGQQRYELARKHWQRGSQKMAQMHRNRALVGEGAAPKPEPRARKKAPVADKRQSLAPGELILVQFMRKRGQGGAVVSTERITEGLNWTRDYLRAIGWRLRRKGYNFQGTGNGYSLDERGS